MSEQPKKITVTLKLIDKAWPKVIYRKSDQIGWLINVSKLDFGGGETKEVEFELDTEYSMIMTHGLNAEMKGDPTNFKIKLDQETKKSVLEITKKGDFGDKFELAPEKKEKTETQIQDPNQKPEDKPEPKPKPEKNKKCWTIANIILLVSGIIFFGSGITGSVLSLKGIVVFGIKIILPLSSGIVLFTGIVIGIITLVRVSNSEKKEKKPEPLGNLKKDFYFNKSFLDRSLDSKEKNLSMPRQENDIDMNKIDFDI